MIIDRLRRLARYGVPLTARRVYAQSRRRRRDQASGARFQNDIGGRDWTSGVELTQVVIKGQLFENKLSNLRRAAAMIDQSLIESGNLWSFWARVGKPSTGNGFLVGRNIVDGKLAARAGGGLCQLSSLVYHLALLGGLEIIERHPHSLDIYQEHERFTPLGADATVVWGFKDLRLRNSHPFAISLGCSLDDNCLSGQIRSKEIIRPLEVSFVREDIAALKARVQTVVGGETLGFTVYEQRPGLRAR
jgi:vancomycin resistance protein VanW